MLKELEGARMPQNLGAANLDPWPIPPLDKFESFISFVDDVDLRSRQASLHMEASLAS